MPRSEHDSTVVKNRRKSPLNPSLEDNLASYALAAGMAGVGVLALASPAEGKIVFTATHQLLSPNTTHDLDVDKDGVNDFHFGNTNFVSHISYPGSVGIVYVVPLQGNNAVIATSPSQFAFAQALNSGAEVSSKATFGRSLNDLIKCGRNQTSQHFHWRSGPWLNVKDKFVGFKFISQGAIHFGWARFTMRQRAYCKTDAVLTGYAYETVANQPIITGQTSDSGESTSADVSLPSQNYPPTVSLPTLNSLALGAPGLWIWRKEENDYVTVSKPKGKPVPTDI
jgi:hypothetical protein